MIMGESIPPSGSVSKDFVFPLTNNRIPFYINASIINASYDHNVDNNILVDAPIETQCSVYIYNGSKQYTQDMTATIFIVT